MVDLVDKDFHEKYLAPEKEWKWFLCNSNNMAHTHNTPAENRYVFQRGQPRLIKDKRDLEYFRKNTSQFVELEDDDEVVITSKPAKFEGDEPIPTPQVDVKVKKKKKGSKKNKGAN